MNGLTKNNKLYVDWCEREAAMYAIDKWHYSTTQPRFKLACLGVWEYGLFVGAVVFGCGATPEIGRPFGVRASEASELVRVALSPKKQSHTSKIVSLATKLVIKRYAKLKVLVSFADEEQGHHGGIYQAMNWWYLGKSNSEFISVHGIVVHPKTLHSKYGVGGQSIPWLRTHVDPNAKRVSLLCKHKYALPLSDDVRNRIEHKRLPYPKRAQSVESDTTDFQFVEGGAIPT